ncbi:MAG: hypothetical protein JF616_17895 [Fibrobacteres bacterium]|nr:hypothetical protein [Fibrobacterota bacterium]
MKAFTFLMTAALATAWAVDVSNPEIGYAVSLPAHWNLAQSKPLQDYFRDSTRAYHSQISILRYSIDKATYPTAASWSQAQFIAYKLSVENSVFPYGAVMYYDSSQVAKIGTVWAPEAYSVMYPADGDPTYCEYIRYAAVGNYGYEIYAIGDSTDMTNNLDFYTGVIATLKFSTPIEAVVQVPGARRAPGTPAEHWFDAMGRKRGSIGAPNGFRSVSLWYLKPGG